MPSSDTYFKKGNKLSPGRPKKENTYSDTLRKLLSGKKIKVVWEVDGKEESLDIKSNKNMYYGIAACQISEALKGNVKAAKEIVDRVQGKAPQTLINEGDDNTAETIEAINKALACIYGDDSNTPDNDSSEEIL